MEDWKVKTHTLTTGDTNPGADAVVVASGIYQHLWQRIGTSDTYAEQGPGGTSVVVHYLAGPDDKVDLYGSVSQPTSFPFLLAAPGNGDDHFIDVEIFVP